MEMCRGKPSKKHQGLFYWSGVKGEGERGGGGVGGGGVVQKGRCMLKQTAVLPDL